MYHMTETTFTDLLPHLVWYSYDDETLTQYEPARYIQVYVNDCGELTEVGSLAVDGDIVTFRNSGGGECGTANVNRIECAVMQQTRII